MVPSPRWLPGVPPAEKKLPYVPAERFSGTGKVWRIWLLGDARCVAVHFQRSQRTVPCILHTGSCPFCTDPTWWKRTEAYGPALLEIRKLPEPKWVPILAVFTAGCYKQLGPTPHRGRMFDLKRESKSERCSALNANFVQESDPLRPSFDVEPLMKRMWWGGDEGDTTIEIPEPIPIPVEEISRPKWNPTPEPIHLSPDELTRLADQAEANGHRALAAKLRADLEAITRPAVEPTPPPEEDPEPEEPTPLEQPAELGEPVAADPKVESIEVGYEPGQPKRHHPSVLAGHPEAQEAVRRREELMRQKTEQERILSEGTARLVCDDLKKLLPSNHPVFTARNGSNGHARRKDGAA